MSGIVADLGLSSDQLDDPGRGFSFRHDGPLDMRFDPAAGGPSAADLLRELDARALEDLLRRHGGEPHARRIAGALVARRREEAVVTTRQLADLVEAVVPRRHEARIHPVTRTFQALRIAVNRELEGLESFVTEAVGVLAPRGRIAVISFHGGEDRAVKTAFRGLSGRCTCPPELPRCTCGRTRLVDVLTRHPVRPGESEIDINPRARSARLRVAERLAA